MPETILPLVLQGFGTSIGLILAIGAQNAFVLRQGLKREYLFPVALVSSLGDFFLIALGIAGLGTLFATTPLLTTLATWGGVLFLIYFGVRSFRAAWKPGALEATQESAPLSGVRAAALTALAFSILNPHAYLDTVVIIGSIGAKYPIEERLWFGAGAMLASLIWFFGLAYGAGWLTPLFKKPLTWRVLDTIIGCIMFAIALTLIFGKR